MARYEVTVHSTLCFSENPPGIGELSILEVVPIRFDGREFIWHANIQPTEYGSLWPSVTVVLDDANDYAAEELATRRFLSAMSFVYKAPMGELDTGASGFKRRLDRPLVISPGRHLGAVVHEAPSGLFVEADDRLRLTLGLAREAVSSDSPFYRFLALYNALDAAFDNNEAERDAFVRRALRDVPLPVDVSTSDWDEYFLESNRHDIAHAVRYPGRPTLDPDAPRDRGRLTTST
jgi:hypothetical protein